MFSKITKRWVAGIMLLVCLLMTVIRVQAEPAKPLIFTTAQGQPSTLLGKNILDEVYNNLGYQVIIQYYPNQRALFMSGSGAVDGEVGRTAVVDSRYPNLHKVGVALFNMDVAAVTLKSKGIQLAELSQIKAHRVGMLRGSKYIESFFNQTQIVYAESFEQLLRLLQKNRIDLVLSEQILVTVELQQTQLERSVFDTQVVNEFAIPVYHFLHSKQLHLLPKVIAELEKMKNNGRLAELAKNFMACVEQGRLQAPDAENQSFTCQPLIAAQR